MAELRVLLDRMGYTEVATLLNSGNIVFRAKSRSATAVGTTMAAAITERFGFGVPVIIKTAAELAAIVHENPFADQVTDPSRLLVVFTQTPQALRALAGLADLAGPREQFRVGKRAAWLHCPAGVLASKVGDALLGKSGRSVTTRNWGTTLKVHALVMRLSESDRRAR